MINHARELTREEHKGTIRFQVGSGEDLAGIQVDEAEMGRELGRESVDLVIAGKSKFSAYAVFNILSNY